MNEDREMGWLQAELDRVNALVPKWQPIEKAPEGKEVLICGWVDNEPGKEQWIATATGVSGRWYADPNADTDDWFYPPTHWMPLPEPPK